MAYIVTTNIIDTKDNGWFYEVGETYPRQDLTVSDARIKDLLKKGLSHLTKNRKKNQQQKLKGNKYE